ncbi:deoxyribonuclease/rho motif-related TRAM [mine drainage metagenome]|uniref:Deoxyribonuclease/rho motif-related TRAM n=1 Tax=mine drainage metagenome TaxID=410659 RepID=T1CF37_9ZZZZ
MEDEEYREDREDKRYGGRRESRMNPAFFSPKPVKVGDEIDVTVEAVASGGDGVAKKDGFVIFVKGAKAGDAMKVKITEVKARFAIGEPVQS